MNIEKSIVEVHVFRETSDGLLFLLLKRSEKVIFPGMWQMVNGHIEENEKAHETALREVKEETGCTPARMWVVPNVNHFYAVEKDFISLIPVFAAQLKDQCEITICEEHCEYRWVNAEQAKTLLAWPGQKKSVDILMEYFMLHPELLNLNEIKLK